MTTSTQNPQLTELMVLQPIHRRLLFAQQRLHNSHVPLRLSAVLYLRITCSAIQTCQRLGFEIASLPAKTSYLTTLKQFIDETPDWWKLCSVSEEGYLTSGDRHIQELLKPLNLFAKQILAVPQIHV